MINTNKREFGSIEFVTAVQPSNGGAAPARPPITIFCGVARFKYTVYTKAYPIKEAKVSNAVKVLT